VAGLERGVRPIGLWSTLTTLSRFLHAADRIVRRRVRRRAVQLARRRGIEGVVDERGFARPRHARHADQQAERQLEMNVLEVVARAPSITILLSSGRLRRRGTGIEIFPDR